MNHQNIKILATQEAAKVYACPMFKNGHRELKLIAYSIGLEGGELLVGIGPERERYEKIDQEIMDLADLNHRGCVASRLGAGTMRIFHGELVLSGPPLHPLIIPIPDEFKELILQTIKEQGLDKKNEN